MFAVVEISGKQYIASPGVTVVVDKIEGEVGATVDFDRILLVSDDKKTVIGTPYIKDKKIHAKITSQGKGEKIHVRRFKSKVRYRKSRGFRPQETAVLIISIE